MNPGNNGQVIGVCSVGVLLGIFIAAICIAIAQWCAPCRLQHAGKRESSLAASVPVRGHSPKNSTSRMENPRRI